jgi:hypothetical protein
VQITVIDFKKAYDSVKRKVVNNILIEFVAPLKLIRLIKICLNGTYSKVRRDKNLPGGFPIQNILKQGGSLSPMLFNCALGDAIRKVQGNQKELKSNGNDMNLFGDNIHTIN